MTELKTLKDLEGYELSDFGIFEDAVLISDLKKEAVKWVKEFRKDKTIGVQLFLDGKKRKGNPLGRALYGDKERKIINNEKIEFIMEFFNLTEEDLE